VFAFITINRHVAGDRTSNLTAPDVRSGLNASNAGTLQLLRRRAREEIDEATESGKYRVRGLSGQPPMDLKGFLYVGKGRNERIFPRTSIRNGAR